ncbi:MAG TPA: carbonic anhydrase [Pirellulaceae bacterium]|jgi:carbonic anhydrase|nr:carbonic anhydrase [Pirellulaceae bacterium]
MQKLVQGLHQFEKDIFNHRRPFFEKLAEGQKPLALFITCSDSRINPNLLTQTEPGELFILRNAGNIIPPYGAQGGGEAATIEYAISVLGVQDVIVCGHSCCGAMAGLLNPESVASLPAVKSWLSYADSTKRIVDENYQHITEHAAKLTLTIEENVLVQIENLKTHPCIAAALGRKTLKVHAWVYKIETGKVFAFDPELEQFAAINGEALPVVDSRALAQAI